MLRRASGGNVNRERMSFFLLHTSNAHIYFLFFPWQRRSGADMPPGGGEVGREGMSRDEKELGRFHPLAQIQHPTGARWKVSVHCPWGSCVLTDCLTAFWVSTFSFTLSLPFGFLGSSHSNKSLTHI